MSGNEIIKHGDHGITDPQWNHILPVIRKLGTGFFMQQVEIPAALGTVRCILHGPVCGEEPVTEEE